MSIVETIDKYLNPEEKDFSVTAEENIIKLANEVNSYDADDNFFTDFLGKFVMHLPFLDLYFKSKQMYQRVIIDCYNYMENTIRSVFAQARSCDSQYARKISNDTEIIKSSSKLVFALADKISPSACGCGDDELLLNIKSFYEENESLFIAMKGQQTIWDYFYNAINDDASEFTKYSQEIYKKLNFDHENEAKLLKYFKGNEENYLKLLDKALEKGIDDPTDAIFDKVLKSISDDEVVIKMIKSMVETTGATNYIKGYAKVIALKYAENQIKEEYIGVINSLKEYKEKVDYPYNELNAKIKDYKKLQGIMKNLETRICIEYRDMYPNNAGIQIEYNEKIAEIDNIEVRLTGSQEHLMYVDK